LKPLPITAQKLIVLLNQEEVNFNEAAEIIEYDGAVASNLLRAANSSAFGGRFPVKNLRDAVVRLGTAALLHIVLADHLKSLSVSAPMYDLMEDDLWQHGAAASLAVKAMIQETRNSRIPKVSAIAALIHDIGKLIMVRYLNVDVWMIRALCAEKKFTFVDAERELFHCDHAEVGGAIARKWYFPEPIRLAIEQHHKFPVPKAGPVLDAVMLANLAAKSIGVGLGAEGMNFQIDYAGCLKRLWLTIEGFERVCAQTHIWLRELRQKHAA